MVDLARLAACLFSFYAVPCDAAAALLPAEIGRFLASDRGPTAASPHGPLIERLEPAWRSKAPASPGPMQKDGSGGAPDDVRSKPTGTISFATNGASHRLDDGASSRVFWARTTNCSLHLRQVLLQI
jgi:hypothetical protein